MANTPTYLSVAPELTPEHFGTNVWSAAGLVCPETDEVHCIRHERLIEQAASVILSDETSEEASLLALSLIELEQGWKFAQGREAIYHILRDSEPDSTLGERAWKLARKMKDPETDALLRELAIYAEEESVALEALRERSPGAAQFAEKVDEKYVESGVNAAHSEDEDLEENPEEDETEEDKDVAGQMEIERKLTDVEKLDFGGQARIIATDPATESWQREKALVVLEMLDVQLTEEEERQVSEFAKFGKIGNETEGQTEEPSEVENSDADEELDESEVEDKIDARARALQLLSKSRSETSLDALARIALFDEESSLRLGAIDALSARPESFAQEVIVTAVLDEDSDIEERVKEIVLESEALNAAAEARLYSLLLQDDESVRRRAMACFGVDEETLLPDEFMTILEKGPAPLRKVVADYLSSLDEFPGDTNQRLISLSRSTNPEDREIFIRALGSFPDDDLELALREIATSDKNISVRNLAIKKISDDPDLEDSEVIKAVFRDGDPLAVELAKSQLTSKGLEYGLHEFSRHVSSVVDRPRRDHLVKTIIAEFVSKFEEDDIARELIKLADSEEAEVRNGARTIREISVQHGWRAVFSEIEQEIREQKAMLSQTSKSEPRERKGFFESLFG